MFLIEVENFKNDNVFAFILIIVGILFISYQFIVWFNFDIIRKFDIWWNSNVFKRHKEPYYGPSDFVEKLSKICGIILFLLGLFFIFIGISIFFVG